VLSDADASIAIETIRTKLNSRIKERPLPMRLNTTNIAPTNIAMDRPRIVEPHFGLGHSAAEGLGGPRFALPGRIHKSPKKPKVAFFTLLVLPMYCWRGLLRPSASHRLFANRCRGGSESDASSTRPGAASGSSVATCDETGGGSDLGAASPLSEPTICK